MGGIALFPTQFQGRLVIGIFLNRFQILPAGNRNARLMPGRDEMIGNWICGVNPIFRISLKSGCEVR